MTTQKAVTSTQKLTASPAKLKAAEVNGQSVTSLRTATATLFNACCKGTHIKTATLT